MHKKLQLHRAEPPCIYNGMTNETQNKEKVTQIGKEGCKRHNVQDRVMQNKPQTHKSLKLKQNHRRDTKYKMSTKHLITTLMCK